MTNQKLPPPPPAEQPPPELVNRPHSPKRSTSGNKYNTDAVQTVQDMDQTTQTNQTNNSCDAYQDSFISEKEQDKAFDNLNEQSVPKRRKSKYRSIDEFLSTYQSAYR